MLGSNKGSFQTRHIVRDGLELDVASRLVKSGDNQTRLTKTETLLLLKLMNCAPDAVPKKELLEDVWGINHQHSSNRLEVYTKRLRAKLEELSGNDYIHNLRGSGYYFAKG